MGEHVVVTSGQYRALGTPRGADEVGRLVLEAKLVTREQLTEAVEESKRAGTSLVEVLAERGYVDELRMCKLFAHHFQLPVVDLREFRVEPDVLSLVPADIAIQQAVLPLHKAGDALRIAIADPDRLGVISAVNALRRYSLFPVLATASGLREKIDEFYRPRDALLRSVLKPFSVAKILGALADRVNDDPSAVRESRESLRGGGSTWTIPVHGSRKGKTVIAVADDHNITIRTVEGLGLAAGAIASRLAEIDAALGELRATAPSEQSLLTSQEEELLAEGGATEKDLKDNPRNDPVMRTAVEYARLLRQSYSTEEAAALLSVNTSRIRQRLTRDRSLYGIRVGKEWRIPKFQFKGKTVIAGLDEVLPRLPENIHPVAVYTWFTTPNVELRSEDEETTYTPLDWLRTGRSPTSLAELAADL